MTRHAAYLLEERSLKIDWFLTPDVHIHTKSSLTPKMILHRHHLFYSNRENNPLSDLHSLMSETSDSEHKHNLNQLTEVMSRLGTMVLCG